MRGLEQGITQLANYEMNAKVRTNAISLLNGIIEDLNAGIKVWESFLQSGNVGSDPGAFGGWAGFSIEKKLFEIDLEARDKARAASGGKSSLDDPIIVLAYAKLGEEETVDERCNNAIDEMRNRIDKVNELIGLINSTKPKKAPVASAVEQSKPKSKAGKKPVSKKSTKKKTSAKKSKKKATKTKAKKKAKKKLVKKTTKKKVAKKKAAKKKASKKKAVKKKASKKKAVKKKAAKKKAKKKKAKRR